MTVAPAADVLRSIRLGISLPAQATVPEMVEFAHRDEHIGFDAVLLPDHLGYTAPLPPLVAITQAAPSVRVGPAVLNTGFYRSVSLARELASVDSATGGRLEIGLGAGSFADEFHASGAPFLRGGERLRVLAEHVATIRALLSDADYIPRPVQAPIPIRPPFSSGQQPQRQKGADA